jgi:hypothetical protein
VSEDILFDSITALGLMIAFYYGLTGFACAIYYRRELLSSAKGFFAAGVMPVLGGVMLAYIFVKSVSDFTGRHDKFLGLASPLQIATIFGILGIAFMLLQRINSPEFFRRKPELAKKGSLIVAPTPQASFATDGDAPGGG